MDIKILGSKITRARKKKNMSQAQLAQLLFISAQAVGKWERGASVPDIVTISQLAEIFGVDLNYFSENEPASSGETGSNAIANRIDDTGNSTAPGLQQPAPERNLLTDFSASDLTRTDFAGITVHKTKFEVSTLAGSDFSDADLTGSSFKISDTRAANFDGANLTDCHFSTLDLAGSSFNKTILIRTQFNKTGLAGVTFANTTLTEVKLIMIDLRETAFEHCIFNGVDFNYCDLRGMCLNGLSFTGVRFDKVALNDVTFKDATLTNVSFRPKFALTNKYYKAIKTICFDHARMDKLTYAALKGMGAGLTKVTIL